MIQKQIDKEQFLDSLTDEDVAEDGYTSVEMFKLEYKLVTLDSRDAITLDKSANASFNNTLRQLFQMGWSPFMLDGQQELLLGRKLIKRINEDYEAFVDKPL